MITWTRFGVDEMPEVECDCLVLLVNPFYNIYCTDIIHWTPGHEPCWRSLGVLFYCVINLPPEVLS